MGNPIKEPITVYEAAQLLKVSNRRVRMLLQLGELRGKKFGRDWQVDSKSVRERIDARVEDNGLS